MRNETLGPYLIQITEHNGEFKGRVVNYKIPKKWGVICNSEAEAERMVDTILEKLLYLDQYQVAEGAVYHRLTS